MLFLFIVIALIIYAFVVYWPEAPDEDALARMAGEQGEELATRRINRALNEDDVLLTNIEIEYDGKNIKFIVFHYRTHPTRENIHRIFKDKGLSFHFLVDIGHS